MNKEFFAALEMLEREKGIPKAYMIERVETALLMAYKKENGNIGNVRVRIDPQRCEVKVYKQLTVVENVTDERLEISLEQAQEKSKKYILGDVYEVEVKTKTFGRLSAQSAKQVIIQGIREAERGMMIKEYEDKKEEIIGAIVLRVDPVSENVVVEIGKNEMVLRRNEQIPGESLQVGDRIKVFITEETKKESSKPSIMVTRAHAGLVKRLFELEVPEIKDGVIEIKSVAREAGKRTKIAVTSNDPNVDPIGACIGPKGSRKNNVSKELNNEKIDIIRYSDINEEYIASALAPATVISVYKTLDSDRSFRVIVDEDQLSLAIGKDAQNVRLAARLTGFKIDIKSKQLSAEAESDEKSPSDD